MTFADVAKAALDTGRGMSPATDDCARLLLSHRINAAMASADQLDGEQLLKRVAVSRVTALAKAAKRAGLWE